MEIQTSRNFDFLALKKGYKKSLKKSSEENLDNVAGQLKDNIINQTHFNEPISPMTRSVRLTRGITSPNPLISTGKLLKSIKTTKTGISVKKYGIMQDEGYLVNNGKEHAFYAPNKRAKSKILYKMKAGTQVPARPWIIYKPKTRHLETFFNSLMSLLRIPNRIVGTKQITIK